LKGLEKMGAEIQLKHGYIEAKTKGLRGADIYLDIPTVTGTENLMMAAALAKGETVIENAAGEPEVVELAEVLNKMGADISGAGSRIIRIKGVRHLRATEHTIMPDRIEAGTLMVAAGVTKGNIHIRNCNLDNMEAVVNKLRETGMEILREDDGTRAIGNKRIKSVDVKTLVLMTLARGLSVISETIFENRFIHVGELRRMGADIKIEGNSAIINGVKGLSGAPVMATDLRASASLVLAGLAAEGETDVSRIYHLDRGYETLVEKLASLGAHIRRIPA
jgi:UDP-N-acetylglucosamine 1-carboxyvinyltransferase